MVKSSRFTHEDVLGLKYGYQFIGKPSLYVHLYCIDGLLIDSGQSKARKEILKDIKSLPIEQIFITHHHEDHSGNAPQISMHHKCPIFAAERCCKLMKNPPPISFAQKMTWGDRPPNFDLQPVAETLNTPNHSFQLIPIPGHAKDMVALFEPNRKWLFSADLYINSYIDYFLDDESMMQQIASLNAAMALDFDVLFCSHKPRLEKPKVHLQNKLDFFQTFFDEVSKHYHQGMNTEEIMKAMNLKENWVVRLSSGGLLSKLNMVRSVVRDLEP